MLDAVAHCRQTAEVCNGVGLVSLHQLAKLLSISKVPFYKSEALVRHEVAQVPLLVEQRVIVVEIVQADDRVAAVKQRLAQPASHKSRRARDEYLHALTSSSPGKR